MAPLAWAPVFLETGLQTVGEGVGATPTSGGKWLNHAVFGRIG
jgi:hypothetical protein